jgi:glycosyltransferase involved in cell wall biosynthesis
MKPLVSVLIPCYNAELWIAQAIRTALNQTWPEKEVIVMDDGSTDRSLDIIKGFGDSIHWETGPNRGGNAARNRLLNLARGDWLQYLDADDYLMSEKIARQVQFLRVFPDAEILYSPLILAYQRPTWTTVETSGVPGSCDIWLHLTRWSFGGTGSGIWRKKAIIEVGGWDERQPCCQDNELYLRLLMGGKRFQFCPHGGYVYRLWTENSVSKRNPRETYHYYLGVVRSLENFLREQKQLNPERLHSINQARFDTARAAWKYDHQFAAEIIKVIQCSQPDFIPQGDAAPARYRMIYHALGFRMAEHIADMLRKRSANNNELKEKTIGWRASTSPSYSKCAVGKRMPRVAILIPCFNAERWIGRAIESTLGQTWPEKEIIVLDHGSTDNSLEIIKSFGDKIQWKIDLNHGGNEARHRLLEMAGGEWIQYLEADNYLLPDKIKNQIEFLVAHGETDVIFGSVILEHCSKGVVRKELLPIPKPHDPWILFARLQLPQISAVLCRKQAILEVGGWKPDQICCQEYELYLRLLMASKHFTFYPNSDTVYRQSGERTSCEHDIPEEQRCKLQIEQRAEDFLRKRNELTPERLRAINRARFEIACAARQKNPSASVKNFRKCDSIMDSGKFAASSASGTLK